MIAVLEGEVGAGDERTQHAEREYSETSSIINFFHACFHDIFTEEAEGIDLNETISVPDWVC